MKKILISTIVISIVFLSALNAENRESIINSITIIFDSSYSMHLDSKFHEALKETERLVNSSELERTEWSLVSFGNTDDSRVELITPFTTDRTKITSALIKLKPWGISPIDKALKFATNYIEHNAKGKRHIIILVSDCISTDISTGTFLGYIKLLKEEKIRNETEKPSNRIDILTLAIPPRENPSLASTIKKNIPNLFSPANFDALIEQITHPQPETEKKSETKSSKYETQIIKGNQRKNPTSEKVSPQKKNTHSIIITVILIPLILLIAFFTYYLFSTRKYLKKEKKPAGKTQRVEIEIVTSSGKREKITLTQFPVTIGTTGDEALFLPKAGNLARRRTCTLRFEGDSLMFYSNKPVILNGVERREKRIKQGDFFILGKYRIFIREISEQTTYRIIKKKSPLPYLILAIGFALLTLQIIVIFPKAREISNRAPIRGLSKNPIQILTEKTPKEKITAKTNRTSEIPEKALKIKKKRVTVYGPGAKIHFFKADILFIHAHPDDESLDFGCLMAEASRDGKKIVTLLFTDGEGGIDQYPNRIVNREYPPHDLHGKNLSRVRVKEATKAMAILGSDVYIRLGLKNHPYNSITEQLPLERVLKDWGGEKKIVTKLVRIIEGFKPELIVSADKHTCAYEHFEHEAVGYLVRKAINRVEKKYNFIKGFIVSVDPLQRECYPKRITIDGMKPLKNSNKGLTPRIIQQVALSQHITQRDASVIGREVLPNFRYEYYHPVIWKMGVTLEKYLSK